MTTPSIRIEPAKPGHDGIIAQHFYQLWRDNNIEPDLIRDDWLDTTLIFIQNARKKLKFQAFIARKENRIIGSVSCQLFTGLYPAVLKQEQRNYGYIWNVYVENEYRRQRTATKLTQTAVNYLKSLDCTKAVLNASPSGKPLYEKLGFVSGNEMVLNLI